MARTTLTIEQLLTMLAAAPPSIAALTAGVDATWLHTAPSAAEWSTNDILAHLRSCADVWGNCIETLLTQDHPTIRAINPTTWIKQTDYHQQAFKDSLEAFTFQRNNLVTNLRTLAEEDWSRSATITGAGKPLQSTVYNYANRLAIHERSHLKQIERLAKMKLRKELA